MSSLRSLVSTGTKVWLDSVHPELVKKSRDYGASGATSNPIIVADIIKSGLFDDKIKKMKAENKSAHDIAWELTDKLVSDAEKVFADVYKDTKANNGFVSFELDPLLEDLDNPMSTSERAAEYVRLGTFWAKNHPNRLIKVPATKAGIAALEELAANGVNINVTLIFSERQYFAARDAVWRGAQKRDSLDTFKSVYSIFVSRLDVYTEKNIPALKPESQGQVGILNAKRVWKLNKDFWADKKTALEQEMIFASTGTKKPEDPKWKYVAAFAGSDIETNPPATNDAVEESGRSFTSEINVLPPADVVADIDAHVDWNKLEEDLMSEGLKKFAEPQKALIKLIEGL